MTFERKVKLMQIILPDNRPVHNIYIQQTMHPKSEVKNKNYRHHMKAVQIIGIYFSLIFLPAYVIAQEKGSWKMQPVAIQTHWAKDVSPSHNLDQYPRPQLVRNNWTNLNGLWDYAITNQDVIKPTTFDGQILVPYPLESALSGVKKSLNATQLLWYKRSLDKPILHQGERVMLNFDAVDYHATVYVNGIEIGQHSGGYTTFSFDITDALNPKINDLLIKVSDPTDIGIGPHGKQVSNPKDIYYTPTSGIWKTVWMEIVPAAHIEALVMTPDIDKGVLNLEVKGKGKPEIIVSDPVSKREISRRFASLEMTGDGAKGTIKIPNTKMWSPSSPFLYDITVKMGDDEVKSYFGMRKINIAKDAKGIDRIYLNNQPYYNLGTLDQGFWPEGLYTAPTDEALAFDIIAIKAMGFNTIRKHIKVEPARWYYHADKLGMLVWQDMVNPNQGLPAGSKAAFEAQCSETLAQLHNYPSIICWVLFNEKWGQYDQQRLSEWIKKTDPSRILNGHSGEILYVNEVLRSPSPNAYVSADMTDVHSYPDPMMSIKQPGKVQVCGEFGGIGVFIPDHQWNTSSAWGYITEKPAGLLAKYKVMNQHLKLMEKQGLSGSIYTQPFDVEGEQNGLMTYDREVVKIPFSELRKIHNQLNPDAEKNVPVVTAQDADLTEPGLKYSAILQQYIDGRRDGVFLKKLAMTATQVGDKLGAELAGDDYIVTLKMPLAEEDINAVIQFTKNTKSPGFKLMNSNAEAFKKVMGGRNYEVAMMTMIMKGEIEPILNQSLNPDWDAIKDKIKPYGKLGDEMFYRAKAITLYNKNDWTNYSPAAKEYLNRYGQNLKKEERDMLEKAIKPTNKIQ